MLENPHTMIQDRHTRRVRENVARVLSTLKGSDVDENGHAPLCQDCERTDKREALPALLRVELPTRALYLCADHYDERKAKDDTEAEIDRMLSNGLHAGNYASSYTSEDLDAAWETLEDEPARDEHRRSKHFRAAYVIGFFGSCEPSEISYEHKEEHDNAMVAWGERMAQLGLAVDLDMCDECDGFVSSDHEEISGHKTVRFNAPDSIPELPMCEPDECVECQSTEKMRYENVEIDGNPMMAWLCNCCGHAHFKKQTL